MLSAVQDGTLSEAEAMACLEHSPHWGWVAIDPVTKLWLTINVGARMRAVAQGVVRQVVQVLAPGCVPLCLTDGFKEYTTALLRHYEQIPRCLRRNSRQGKQPYSRCCSLRPRAFSSQILG